MTAHPDFPSGVDVHELSADECSAVAGLAGELAQAYASAQDPDFVADARRIGFARLPRGVVACIARFRERESSAAVAITGFPVDDRAVGPTPPHWRDPGSTLREELYLTLLGSLLGDLFGWATLQEGRLVANVVPIRDQEREQSGHGSTATLAWHTEDAFHPCRCDYLGLMGIRNDAGTPTTFASVDSLVLSDADRALLAEPRFVIRADDEHFGQRLREGGPDGPDGERLPSDWADPPPTAVLFGDLRSPYLRIDPHFMCAVPGDADAECALASAVAQLDAALEDVVLRPGSACFIDNYRAVHGRRSYSPAYDGRDRWLKKVVVTRDLRRSRAARACPEARVLAPTRLAEEPIPAGSPG
jgi:Fe(II)/alpha-ketoglutarate-dependent arginine beta-hydroxylase